MRVDECTLEEDLGHMRMSENDSHMGRILLFLYTLIHDHKFLFFPSISFSIIIIVGVCTVERVPFFLHLEFGSMTIAFDTPGIVHERTSDGP